jgi:hypothetical protein
MKKFVLLALTVGLLAGTANAASLYMEWAAEGGATATHDMEVGDSAVINIYVDLLAGETFSTLAYANSAQPLVSQTGTTVVPANWGNGSFNGTTLGAGGQQIAFAANNPLVDFLSGPSPYTLIGTQTVQLSAAASPGDPDVPVAFQDPTLAGMLFYDMNGAPFTWDARYNTSYSGYVAFANYGNPGWGLNPAKGHQPTPNPLYINIIPEPSALALLALGGFSLLRRRR